MDQNAEIDHGRAFDWGRTSPDYAKYRDIYPEAFYQKILDLGLCAAGQEVLDLGTGTGVLPRSLYRHGARFTGIDSAENQIAQADALARAQGMEIAFRCVSAEACGFPDGSFDVVTACQCFTYFDHGVLAPRIARLLKPGGRFAVLYMAWLPLEDAVAGASEALALRFNPDWTGCGEVRRPIDVPAVYGDYFTTEHREVFDLRVPFSREGWHGRMKSCRGIGASLSDGEIARFDREHRALLERLAPPEFEVLHYAAVTVLKKR